MASISPNTESLQLGRSHTAPSLLDLRWFLGAAHLTASAAGAELVWVHHLLNNFYKLAANLLLRRPSYNYYCCSGGHRTTTTAAPTAIKQLLLLLWPSHNSCSGGYGTRELFFFDLRQYFKMFHQLLQCYSHDLPVVLGEVFLIFWRVDVVKPPISVSQISVGVQS